jgi:hypothetical protein
MGNGSSRDADFELEGNHGALDINEDAHVFTCLQVREVSVGLTFKEHD